MLISFAVTAKLICVFVFAYAKSRFSHNEAQMVGELLFPVIDNFGRNRHLKLDLIISCLNPMTPYDFLE